MLNGWPNRLYVATLPTVSTHQATIDRHIVRRGGGWQLVSCTGLLQHDLTAIDRTLGALPQPRACLIDGLTNWLLMALELTADPIGSGATIAAGVTTLAERVAATWILIDTTTDAIAGTIDEHVRLSAEIMHERLRVILTNQPAFGTRPIR